LSDADLPERPGGVPRGGAPALAPHDELTRRIHAVEEAYEFMLAYAAQGLSGDAAARADGQVRGLMTAAAEGLRGMGALVTAIVRERKLDVPEKYGAFREVLDRDAQASLAMIELVLAQPVIGSQLVDNLNASIHVRALLTDLFLLDEILKEQMR
jgi:hypothetical protein